MTEDHSLVTLAAVLSTFLFFPLNWSLGSDGASGRWVARTVRGCLIRYIHPCEQPSVPVLSHGRVALSWGSYLLFSLHYVYSYRQEGPEQDRSCGQGCQSGDTQGQLSATHRLTEDSITHRHQEKRAARCQQLERNDCQGQTSPPSRRGTSQPERLVSRNSFGSQGAPRV